MALTPASTALETRTFGSAPEEAIRYARDRIGAALRFLAGAVGVPRLRLGDSNGPKGGIDKTCRVEVAVQGEQRLSVEATAATWTEAIDLAASRLRRRLTRRNDRRRP